MRPRPNSFRRQIKTTSYGPALPRARHAPATGSLTAHDEDAPRRGLDASRAQLAPEPDHRRPGIGDRPVRGAPRPPPARPRCRPGCGPCPRPTRRAARSTGPARARPARRTARAAAAACDKRSGSVARAPRGGRSAGHVHRPRCRTVRVQPHLPQVRHMRESARSIEVHCLTHTAKLAGGSDTFAGQFPISTKRIPSISIFAKTRRITLGRSPAARRSTKIKPTVRRRLPEVSGAGM